MIKKVLIFNYTGWNQIPASLVEGLKLNKDLKLFSTSRSNYGYDIMIKASRAYIANAHLDFSSSTPRLVPWLLSAIENEEEYNKECKELMELCDLILIFDNNHKESTAHYYIGSPPNVIVTPESDGTDDTVIRSLHDYAIINYKDKIAFVDMQEEPTQAEMYGKYWGGHPEQCKVYFKTEKNNDLLWDDNVEPLPFASEERYFTSEKNFNLLWDKKDISVCCLFKDTPKERLLWHTIIDDNRSEDLRRPQLKEIIKKYCSNHNFKSITTAQYDREIYVDPKTETTVDSKTYGVDIREINFAGTAQHGEPVSHSHSYYKSLLRSKINIEGLPGNGAFYTGRMMESLANGCCYFYPIPAYNVDFPNGLIDGEDFIIYSNGEDLIDKVEYYLSHEDEMRTIAKNGFNKLLKYHTSEVRAKEFIATCERYMYD